jgi:hypothetical protein
MFQEQIIVLAVYVDKPVQDIASPHTLRPVAEQDFF